jgi:hypothetical protein
MRPTGRPPKWPALRLTERVVVRLTPDQVDRLYRESFRLRMSLSDLIRERLFLVVQKDGSR